MTITIDNLDGNGPVDYSGSLLAESSLRIERTLNAPSKCAGALVLDGRALPVPVRRGRVVVADAQGNALFTGYLVTEPAAVYLGTGAMGAVYRYGIDAVSDEWLLDRLPVPTGGSGLGVVGGLLLRTLTNRVDAGLLSSGGVADVRTVGVFQPVGTEAWSLNAGALAGAAYGSYRVLNGGVSFASVGAVTHTLGDGDGIFSPAGLAVSAIKELANDVTVSGEREPAAYVTELFAGDGTTAVFALGETPFAAIAAQAKVIDDSFDQAVFDPAVWQLADPGSHLGLGAGGLTMTGGNGFDGQTTLTAIDLVEMGGALVIEAGAVTFGSASDGVLCGMYSGVTSRANCFAGLNVRQSGGNTIVTPMVNGAEVGTSYTLGAGHHYTMRIRLHCVEDQRVLQSFYARVDGTVEAFGGGLVDAPMSMCFELVDLGASSNTPATVLFDTASTGIIASAPATCQFSAVNAVQMFGSMGFCRVTQTGSVRVVSALASGTTSARLIGAAGEGVDCEVQHSSGGAKVSFFAGRIPVAGETVTVTYRRSGRAIARAVDAASVALEAAGGGNGTARWLGRVVRPQARSSQDCESAALAVLSFASARAAALSGTYAAEVCTATGSVTFSGGDVWPGDVLSLTTNGDVLNVIVRRVVVEDGHAVPEVLQYKVSFANDWAEGLGLGLSEAIAADVLLPDAPSAGVAGVLANLQTLAVVSATDTALQVDAGVAAPAGGGFEVRLRDNGFAPGAAADLVLRSPVRSFSIPRVSFGERYFVRMYDASSPPLYSRWSSAVYCNLPVG